MVGCNEINKLFWSDGEVWVTTLGSIENFSAKRSEVGTGIGLSGGIRDGNEYGRWYIRQG